MRPAMPKLEERSAEDIYRHLIERWDSIKPMEGSSPGSRELREALMRIFARYFEIIAERLNQAPDKNYLAFLNTIGASQIPPTPATVPLTFTPVNRSADHSQLAMVPAKVKVAAPAAADESEPVVFETLRPMRLTRAVPRKVISHDPLDDLYSDLSDLNSTEPCASRPIFEGMLPVEHGFYIGHSAIFGVKKIVQFRIRFDLEFDAGSVKAQNPLEWSISTREGPVNLRI